MDPFVKAMEERTRARRQLINKLEDHSAPQAKRPLEDHADKSNGVTPEKSPKRLCANSEDKENEGYFFGMSSHRVRGLAALRNQQSDEPEPPKQAPQDEPPAPKEVGQLKRRLADLAARWAEQDEDDDMPRRHQPSPSSVKCTPAPAKPTPTSAPTKPTPTSAPAKPTPTSAPIKPTPTSTPAKSIPTSPVKHTPVNPAPSNNPPKPKTPLDRSVVRTLESQGFVKTPSESRIAYAFNGSKPSPEKPVEKPGLTPSKINKPVTSQKRDSSPPHQDDPSALPLAKRMALFEQKSSAPARPPVNPEKLSISERVRLFEKAAQDSAESAKKVFNRPPAGFSSRPQAARPEHKEVTPTPTSSKHVAFGPAQVFSYQPDETAEESSVYPETEEDAQSSMEEEEEVLEEEEEEAGPAESSTEVPTTDDPGESSFEVPSSNMEHTIETDDYTDVYTDGSRTFDEETLEEAEVLNKNPELLEVSSEMTQEEEEDTQERQLEQEELEKYRSPLALPSKESKQSGAGLFYTLSFYRKQQQKLSTPVRPVIKKEVPIITDTEEDSSDTQEPPEDPTVRIQERLKILEEEAIHHTTVIGQTSQALSLCYSTPEFHHSQEQLAAERLLLIHTQKRRAVLDETQRLKREGVFGPAAAAADGSSASLSVSDVCLSVRGEPQPDPEVVHYFICLLRCGAYVYATETLALTEAARNRLTFPNYFIFHDVTSDFKLVLEVYALTTKKEELPEDKKYHIKKTKGKGWLTKKDSKMFSPAVASPGGPHAIRTPQFTMVGATTIDIQSHNRQAFVLEKVPFSTALDGLVTMKLKLSVEYSTKLKGFLTMFEEVGGFGAWQRRWCYLQGPHILYWRYPENEGQPPQGRLDLTNCVTEEVGPVPRDVCCRPNTLQLVMVRPTEPGDRDSLICEIKDSFTRTRHHLSADSKEERALWCQRLNAQLQAMRRWRYQQS